MNLNFDAKGDAAKELVRGFFESSREANRYKREEFQRIYKMYKNVSDLTGKDKNRSNLHIPKLYSNIETIVPIYHDAILGSRPYIPMEASNKRDSAVSDTMTQLLDEYLHESEYFWETTKWIKYVLLYGTAFIESRPVYRDRVIKVYKPDFIIDAYGNQVEVGGEFVEEVKRYFGLGVRAYAPWDIYNDWNYGSDTVDGSRAVVKFRGLVSKRQVKEMANRGEFGEEFDFDKIDAASEELKEDDWAKRIAIDIGINLPHEDDDLGPWLSYESQGRYIDLWGFNLKLRDIDNPFNHQKINLTRIINTDDPNYFNAWYGVGEGKPIEQLVSAMNDNYNQAFDNHNMMNHKVIAYDEEAVSVDQLVMVAGNRIPMTPGLNQKAEDIFHEFAVSPMSSDFYNIPAIMNSMIDDTMGVHEPLRGAEGTGKTAREAILLRRAGDSRMKVKIRMGEQMGLKDFGEKATSIIAQFAQIDDIVDKIGIEKASSLPTVDPKAFDGRINYVFKGSARFADSQVQRQNAIDIYQLMSQNPIIDQATLTDWALEKFDIDADQRAKFINDPKEMMLQQLLAQQGGAETTRSAADGRTIGGSGGNTPTGRDQSERFGV